MEREGLGLRLDSIRTLPVLSCLVQIMEILAEFDSRVQEANALSEQLDMMTTAYQGLKQENERLKGQASLITEAVNEAQRWKVGSEILERICEPFKDESAVYLVYLAKYVSEGKLAGKERLKELATAILRIHEARGYLDSQGKGSQQKKGCPTCGGGIVSQRKRRDLVFPEEYYEKPTEKAGRG